MPNTGKLRQVIRNDGSQINWYYVWINNIWWKYHCVKSVGIRSFSGPYFPALGLNTEIYAQISVFRRNAGKYGPEKLQIRTLFAQVVLSRRVFEWIVILIGSEINPLSPNFTKWSNTPNNLSALADKLFECVWPFCGVGA